jgi:hypothetical protein
MLFYVVAMVASLQRPAAKPSSGGSHFKLRA